MVNLSLILAWVAVIYSVTADRVPGYGGYNYRYSDNIRELEEQTGYGGYNYGYSSNIGEPKAQSENDFCDPPIQIGLIVSPFLRYYEIGSSIQLSCEAGYELTMRNWSTCRKLSYRISKTNFYPATNRPACRKIPRCQLPIQEGLVVSPLKTFYDIGEEISLSCEDGYIQRVTEKKTCTRRRSTSFTNLFSNEALFYPPLVWICEKKRKCQVPLLEGLIVTPFKPFYSTDEEVDLSCDEGYELVINDTSTCGEAGLFTGLKNSVIHPTYGNYYITSTAKACRKKPSCSPPFAIGLSMEPRKERYMEGEQITIYCSEDFDLMGVATRTCVRRSEVGNLIVASFDPVINLAICKKKPSCSLPAVPGLIITPVKPMYAINETITLSCKDGYELTVPDSSVCQQSPYSEITVLQPFVGGRFLPGISRGACRKIVNCERPNQEGLIIAPSSDTYDIGQTIELSCEEGYKLSGKSTRTCERSQAIIGWIVAEGYMASFEPPIWDGVCRKMVKCQAPDDKNLIITPYKEEYMEGDEIELGCPEGYSLVASKKMTCDSTILCGDPFYSYTEGGCFLPMLRGAACVQKASCKVPKLQEGLTVTPSKESYYTDDVITLSCAEGYELNIPEKHICKKQKYRAVYRSKARKPQAEFKPGFKREACTKIPTCKMPEGEGLIVTPAMEEYAMKEEITLSCIEGYVLVVPEETRICDRPGLFYPPLEEKICRSLAPCLSKIESQDSLDMAKCLAKLMAGVLDEEEIDETEYGGEPDGSHEEKTGGHEGDSHRYEESEGEGEVEMGGYVGDPPIPVDDGEGEEGDGGPPYLEEDDE